MTSDAVAASLMDNAQGSESMAGMTSHTRQKSRTPGLGAAWAVLIGTGVTSVTYNVVHAVPVLQLALALLLGFMPAFVAACLSHLAAVLDAPWWVKTAVTGVMLSGMVLSASATASVVAPADAGWRGWLFGVTLDAAALLALWAIMSSRRRGASAAAAAAEARAEAEAATMRAGALEAELADMRDDLEEAEAAHAAEVEALTSALNKARTSPQKRARSSAPNKRPASPRNSGAEDIDTQAEALSILLADPDISGGELGRRLGKSERYGCMLKKKLAASASDSPG